MLFGDLKSPQNVKNLVESYQIESEIFTKLIKYAGIDPCERLCFYTALVATNLKGWVLLDKNAMPITPTAEIFEKEICAVTYDGVYTIIIRYPTIHNELIRYKESVHKYLGGVFTIIETGVNVPYFISTDM